MGKSRIDATPGATDDAIADSRLRRKEHWKGGTLGGV